MNKRIKKKKLKQWHLQWIEYIKNLPENDSYPRFPIMYTSKFIKADFNKLKRND